MKIYIFMVNKYLIIDCFTFFVNIGYSKIHKLLILTIRLFTTITKYK